MRMKHRAADRDIISAPVRILLRQASEMPVLPRLVHASTQHVLEAGAWVPSSACTHHAVCCLIGYRMILVPHGHAILWSVTRLALRAATNGSWPDLHHVAFEPYV